jgi:site-specific DNA-adenine methylase
MRTNQNPLNPPTYTSYDARLDPTATSSSTSAAHESSQVEGGELEFDRPIDGTPTSLFPMHGDKTMHLEHDALSEPLLAAAGAEDCKRFIDAFTGTTATALWLAKQGKLPSECILNEISDLRNIDINQSIHHPDEVNEKIRAYMLKIRQICYKTMHDLHIDSKDVPETTLKRWEESARFGGSERAKCSQVAKDYLIGEIEKQWDPNKEWCGKKGTFKDEPTTAALHRLFSHSTFQPGTPVMIEPYKRRPGDVDNNRFLSLASGGFGLQCLGTRAELGRGEGPNRAEEYTAHMEASTIEVSTSLKDADVKAHDGWKLAKDAKPGDLLFLDPPYLLKEGVTKYQAIRYASDTSKEYDAAGFCELMKDVEDAANRGVRVVLTNRMNSAACTWLQSRGWRVEDTIEISNSKTSDMIVTNFIVKDGKLKDMLEIGEGKGSKLANLPGAYQGRWDTRTCQTEDGQKSLWGIEIGEKFYTEENGEVCQYSPVNARKLRNRSVAMRSGGEFGREMVWQRDPKLDIRPTERHEEKFPRAASTLDTLVKRGNLEVESLEKGRSGKRIKT